MYLLEVEQEQLQGQLVQVIQQLQGLLQQHQLLVQLRQVLQMCLKEMRRKGIL